MTDSFDITLDSLGRTYPIPVGGATDWRNGVTRYLRDSSTVINSLSSGSLITPVVNVRNYGATGNGTTDDTAAIQAAMVVVAASGATGGTLYFPSGTYKYTSTLQFGVAVTQTNVKITGDGFSSILKPTGSFSTSPTIELRNVNYWELTSLKFDASARTGTGDTVLIDGCSYGLATNCTFTGASRYGVNISQVSGAGLPSYNTVTGNVYSSNSSGNVHIQVGTTGNIVNNTNGIFGHSPYLNLLDFGAVGDGAVDDTAAVQAALTYVAANHRALFVPGGTYKLTSTVSVTGGSKFLVLGEQRGASVFKWGGSNGGVDDMFQFIGCQLWGLSHLQFRADTGLRPRALVHSLVNGSGLAAYGMVFDNIICDGTGSSDLFEYGFWFSTTGTGNNSEVTYFKVEVNKAKTACFQIEGSQAKGHNFYECSATTAPYGLRYLDAGFGASTGNWHGGTMAEIQTGFSMPAVDAPIEINNVDTEEMDRFFDGASGTVGQNLHIHDCRVDSTVNSGTAHYDSMIRIGTAGPTKIMGNQFVSGASGNIRINYITQSAGGNHSIDGNFFESTDSYLVSPANWDAGNTGPSSCVKIGRTTANIYEVGGSHAVGYRLEGLDWTFPETTVFALQNNSGDYNTYVVVVGISTFTAAATSQTKSFTLPQGVRIKGMALYQNQKLALGGAPLITCKIGSTSGGDEYLLATDVSASNSVFLNDPAQLGLLLSGMPSAGYVPNYFGTSTGYLTLTSASGNLGNGSVTNLTGDLRIILSADIAPRWLRVA